MEGENDRQEHGDPSSGQIGSWSRDTSKGASPREMENFLPAPATDKHKEADRDEGNFCKVDARFLPVKLFYFLMGGAVGSFTPFVHLHFYQLGLSTFFLGIISSIRPVMVMVSTPFWGSLADKFRLHRFFLFCCTIGLCVSPVCLIFIPESNQNICDMESTRHFETGTKNYDVRPTSLVTLFLTADEEKGYDRSNATTEKYLITAVDGAGDESVKNVSSEHVNSYKTFLPAFFSMLFIYMFVVNYHVLTDSVTLQLCKMYPSTSYGRQRFMASISVITMSVVSGFLLEWSERRGAANGEACYKSKYIAPIAVTCGALAFVALLPLAKITVVSKGREKSRYRSFFKLFKGLDVLRFLLVLIVTGASKGITATYLFLFLEDLDASKILIGLCLVCECLAEVPFMLLSQRLIDKLGSNNVIKIGIAAHSVRQLTCSFLRNPALVLPIETLHGLTFGLLWPSLVVYANQIAPEGLAATMQATVSAFSEGIGELTGILIGGAVYGRFGPRVLFQGTAGSCFLLLLVTFIPVKSRRRSERIPDDDLQGTHEY